MFLCNLDNEIRQNKHTGFQNELFIANADSTSKLQDYVEAAWLNPENYYTFDAKSPRILEAHHTKDNSFWIDMTSSVLRDTQ